MTQLEYDRGREDTIRETRGERDVRGKAVENGPNNWCLSSGSAMHDRHEGHAFGTSYERNMRCGATKRGLGMKGEERERQGERATERISQLDLDSLICQAKENKRAIERLR